MTSQFSLPVPETPTVTRTFGCAARYSSATASVIGNTVEEPSMATRPERPLPAWVSLDTESEQEQQQQAATLEQLQRQHAELSQATETAATALKAAQAELEQAKRALANGVSLMIFPEGTRSRDGQLLPKNREVFNQFGGSLGGPIAMSMSAMVGAKVLHEGTVAKKVPTAAGSPPVGSWAA